MGDGYKKNVGFIGSISLLVTSITGPGIVLIPIVFQEAGWVFPVIIFLLIAFLSGFASLLVVESATRFPNNENFERNVEFTVMVHQFYGRKWYYLFLFILYGSLQSTNVASIVGSAQIFDTVFVDIFGGTCGYGIHPKSGLYCVTEVSNTNSPFGDNMMFATFGYLFVIAMIVPMTQIDLNDNMFLQLVSLGYNGLFMITVLILAIGKGFDSSLVPAIGENISTVVAMANTVPSWMNVKHPSVSPKKSMWWSILICVILYTFTGFVGGLSYKLDRNTNLLQAMFADKSLSRGGKGWLTFIYFVFPWLTYITSIPVAMIVVRLNFLAAKLLSPGKANFFAVWLPFIIGIPLQTGSAVTLFGTYTSLTFQSLCNFFAPFLIFLFLSKRNVEMAQSVLEELEFLDINAGIKKSSGEDDLDNFDYIYHLPSANPNQIRFRDPFKETKLKPKSTQQKAIESSLTKLAISSNRSIPQIRAVLSSKGETDIQFSTGASNINNAFGSVRSLAVSDNGKSLDVRSDSVMKRKLTVNRQDSSAFGRRLSARKNKDYPSNYDIDGSSANNNLESIIVSDFGQDENGDLILIQTEVSRFRAMPDVVYSYLSPIWLAGIGFVCMVALVFQAVISEIS